MKLSMMSYTLARLPGFEVRKMFEMAVRLQLDGLDMVTLYEHKPSDIRKMSEDFGIPLVAYTFFARELANPDPQIRAAGQDKVKQGMEVAAELGVPTVMLPPAPLADVLDRAVNRRNYIDGLRPLMPFIRATGIDFSVENFPGAASPFVSSADFLEAAAELPGLKLTFDNGNASSGGEEVGASFSRVAPYVVHAHFKDWTISPTAKEGWRPMSDGRWYKAALIGEGDIDQVATVRAMEKAGYDKYINIEYEGNDYSAETAMEKAVAYLRGIMA